MINIAIDGPAGAGKSTVAKMIAKKLNILYLDTGAMYRAVAYRALSYNLKPDTDIDKIIEMLKDTVIDIRYNNDKSQIVIINGIDVTQSIREHFMSKAASDISKIPEVRIKLVMMQRDIAKNNNVVLDGRDITSYVLPNAKYKFYMTATAECRAKRRYDELIDKGQQVNYDDILKDIKDRDYNDSTRAFAPLKKTEDSILIDTSNMTIDDVVDKILSYVEEDVK
jgi:cytidylate kinase